MNLFLKIFKLKKLIFNLLIFTLIACSGCTEEEVSEVPFVSTVRLASEVSPSIKLNNINDLEATPCIQDFCTLVWTVPIQIPEAKEIQSYDVRYSDKPITNNDNFDEAIKVDSSDIKPLKGGDSEEIIILGLQKETEYYFAVKVVNQTDQISDYSNVANGFIKPIKLNKITDLEVYSCKQDFCTLGWTVPMTKPEAQEIRSYDVRYSVQPITNDEHFNEAIKVDTSNVLPLKEGDSEEFTIKGLKQDTKYYFAIRVVNYIDQSSDYSNVVDGFIDPLKLNKITDLKVSFCKGNLCNINWTVPTNEPNLQEIQSYDVRYSVQPITDDLDFKAATPVDTSTIYPLGEGEKEQFIISRLDEYTTYYFAINSSNEINLTSDYSNVVDGTTKPAGIVFEDNFDEHDDWTPEQLTTGYGYWQAEESIPKNYHSYRMQGSAFSNSVGNNSLSITPMNHRGPSGKALTVWNETATDSSSWISDSLLGLELEDDHESIFIRFFIKFDPLWQWGSGNGSPLQKFFRVSHRKQGKDPFVMFSDGAHQPMMIHDLAKWSGGASDISVFTNFRYTNAYYPESAIPNRSKNMTTYFEGGNYGGNGTDFYDTGMPGDGEWHEWKFYVKMNSAEGIADGVYKFWQDNKLIVEVTDLAWQDEGATQRKMWNYIMLGGNNFNKFAASSEEIEQWYAIDDLVVSASDIPSTYIPLNDED